MKKRTFYLSLIISLVIFFLISCFGAGKLNLLSKNRTNKKDALYIKKLIIFLLPDRFELIELKRLL